MRFNGFRDPLLPRSGDEAIQPSPPDRSQGRGRKHELSDKQIPGGLLTDVGKILKTYPELSWDRAVREIPSERILRKHRWVFLSKDTFDDLSVHIGEPELPALVAEGEALVIDPKEVENGRVEIMDVDGILRDAVT